MRRGSWFDAGFAGGFGPFGGFGPRAGRGGFFRPGEVRLALLSLLAEGPAHGYELMKRLEKRSGGIYQASAGTVYPVLQQLEDEGLVRSQEQDGKKVYAITDAGREELAKDPEAVERIWHRADRWHEWGSWCGPETTEVASGVGRLVKAAFQAASRGGPDRVDQVRHILDRARRDLEGIGRA